ncbi:hypothetical protein AAVH_13317 [Aphelenchoides avenae]|nr:hypothetical protein AAVH_13317 [Aphelenchus avenae]
MRLARVLRRIKRQLSKYRKTKDSAPEKDAPVFTLQESGHQRAIYTHAFDDADNDYSTLARNREWTCKSYAQCRLIIAGKPKPVDNADPTEWTVLVTDGRFKADLFTEFKPSFGIGDEVVVTRIAVRPDGASGRLNLFIKNYAHVNPAAEKKLPRPVNMEEMPFLAIASYG